MKLIIVTGSIFTRNAGNHDAIRNYFLYFHIMATLHLIIQGKVQGVFYRVSARKKAIEIGISGWIKNTPEHHVEVMARGTEAQLQQFIEWCKQGPPKARVDNIITEKAAEHYFDEFKILH